eukprot:scaffold706_cov418-Prasinococcus_capsulatus_cf.AAC.44
MAATSSGGLAGSLVEPVPCVDASPHQEFQLKSRCLRRKDERAACGTSTWVTSCRSECKGQSPCTQVSHHMQASGWQMVAGVRRYAMTVRSDAIHKGRNHA